MKTHFQRSIEEKNLVPAGIDSRHVEGYIRLQYATLSHLGWPTIRRECRVAVDCVRQGGALRAEDLAQSFGL